MDWIHHLLWRHDKFLGTDWTVWTVIGFAGNATFASRFIVQWYATEKRKRVSMPVAFWWLSLAGSLTLLLYAICANKDLVVILAYAFAWIPYIRNLIIHYRHEREKQECGQCGERSSPTANYCARCGARLKEAEVKPKTKVRV